MARIKLNFSRLPLTEKIARARQIVTALTGNTDFPRPTPELVAITAAIDALEAAFTAVQVARQEAKTKTSDQNSKEDIVDRLLTQLASYVEAVAGDNQTLIQSAGMDVRGPAISTSETPTQPAALTATAGDHDGEIDLSWDTIVGAKSYIIEKSPDPPTATSWSHAGVSTKSKTTISDLTSGTRYWFRVAAINSNGQSGWSDPAVKIAP
jgi:fibronectin type III domain protein